jgi:hypothetical protein
MKCEADEFGLSQCDEDAISLRGDHPICEMCLEYLIVLREMREHFQATGGRIIIHNGRVYTSL